MPCNASPFTNNSPAPRKSAFAASATKHPWNSRFYELKETNQMSWWIYACPGFFPSATEAPTGTLNRYELNSHDRSDTANYSKPTLAAEFDLRPSATYWSFDPATWTGHLLPTIQICLNSSALNWKLKSRRAMP